MFLPTAITCEVSAMQSAPYGKRVPLAANAGTRSWSLKGMTNLPGSHLCFIFDDSPGGASFRKQLLQ